MKLFDDSKIAVIEINWNSGEIFSRRWLVKDGNSTKFIPMRENDKFVHDLLDGEDKSLSLIPVVCRDLDNDAVHLMRDGEKLYGIYEPIIFDPSWAKRCAKFVDDFNKTAIPVFSPDMGPVKNGEENSCACVIAKLNGKWDISDYAERFCADVIRQSPFQICCDVMTDEKDLEFYVVNLYKGRERILQDDYHSNEVDFPIESLTPFMNYIEELDMIGRVPDECIPILVKDKRRSLGGALYWGYAKFEPNTKLKVICPLNKDFLRDIEMTMDFLSISITRAENIADDLILVNMQPVIKGVEVSRSPIAGEKLEDILNGSLFDAVLDCIDCSSEQDPSMGRIFKGRSSGRSKKIREANIFENVEDKKIVLE